MNTEILPRGGLILCAVSGGTDSMYLLCKLREMGYPIAAGHYHHGLRAGEADRDEAFVRAFCAEQGIPFRAGHGDVAVFAAQHGMGVEEAARTLRYAFLEETADLLGAAVIATGHTADDNAETVLMNLTRGAGLRGLCGIPPVRGRIVRPMLDVTRREAEEYLAARGIAHVEDRTNAEDAYTRNRIRHRVIPVLTEENPAFAEAVGRAAALLREDESYLSGLAEDFIRQNEEEGSLPASALLALPAPVARRAVRMMAGRGLSEEHVRAILGIARDGGSADVPGMRVGLAGERLVFGASESHPIAERELRPGEELTLHEAGLAVRCERLAGMPEDVYKSLNIFYFKCENICGSIKVASRNPGDRYRPAGRGCTKTLKALFREAGVPFWERDSVPVLRDDEGIVGVFGFPPAERVCAEPGDKDVYKIDFLRLMPERGGYEDASGC